VPATVGHLSGRVCEIGTTTDAKPILIPTLTASLPLSRSRTCYSSPSPPPPHGRRRAKPFAFVEFTDIDEAHDAKDGMDRREFQGRVIEVVFAQQKRKSPGEMRHRDGAPPPRR
jgi:hypothetical protein